VTVAQLELVAFSQIRARELSLKACTYLKNMETSIVTWIEVLKPPAWAESGRFGSKNEFGAGDGTRTRDSLLGRQELYHLSYSRIVTIILAKTLLNCQKWHSRLPSYALALQ
jgi:hypothetical protein